MFLIIFYSFWVKFGQRRNMPQSTYISEPSEYFDMMNNESQEAKDAKFVTDEMVRLDWMYKQDFIQASGCTNVVVAAYTTAQARLKLYGYWRDWGRRLSTVSQILSSL